MIALDGVTVQAGSFRIQGVTFQVPTGAYAVLMGKTGSGKTTLLEAISGLRPVVHGRIRLGARDVTPFPPAQRGVGYVPQDRALFPTMTVREQLGFGPSVRGWPAPERSARVEELSRLLGIGPLLDRRPVGLSGGESQRVAIGRALAARPGILLLDEPLTALDDETREEIMELLRAVRKQSAVTVLHVTHSREEARRLADLILILREGAVHEAARAEVDEELP